MDSATHDERITIRDLQRNAADVFDRARQGHTFIVTRHGEMVGRIVPPDPSEEAVERLIADGLLDPAHLANLPMADEFSNTPREPSPPGTRLGSEAIMEMREDRWEG